MMAAPIGPRPRTTADDAAHEYRQRCAERLASVRLAAGLSTYTLAMRCGFTDASIITRYERGVMPSLSRQFRLAMVLDVEPDQLWGFGP